MMGRFFITFAMNTGAQISFEVVPTELRGQGNALANVMAQGTQFFSPYIVYSVTDGKSKVMHSRLRNFPFAMISERRRSDSSLLHPRPWCYNRGRDSPVSTGNGGYRPSGHNRGSGGVPERPAIFPRSFLGKETQEQGGKQWNEKPSINMLTLSNQPKDQMKPHRFRNSVKS